jgi:hypothetical protein
LVLIGVHVNSVRWILSVSQAISISSPKIAVATSVRSQKIFRAKRLEISDRSVILPASSFKLTEVVKSILDACAGSFRDMDKYESMFMANH